MADMVEAVAKAIHDTLENDDDSEGGGYMRAARAAIAAMREPTEAMLDAYEAAHIVTTQGEELDREALCEAWTTMALAALTPGSTPAPEPWRCTCFARSAGECACGAWDVPIPPVREPTAPLVEINATYLPSVGWTTEVVDRTFLGVDKEVLPNMESLGHQLSILTRGLSNICQTLNEARHKNGAGTKAPAPVSPYPRGRNARGD